MWIWGARKDDCPPADAVQNRDIIRRFAQKLGQKKNTLISQGVLDGSGDRIRTTDTPGMKRALAVSFPKPLLRALSLRILICAHPFQIRQLIQRTVIHNRIVLNSKALQIFQFTQSTDILNPIIIQIQISKRC